MKRSEPEQYLYEHPNLLDDSFSVPMTEAEQWAKNAPIFVDSASVLGGIRREHRHAVPGHGGDAVFHVAGDF